MGKTPSTDTILANVFGTYPDPNQSNNIATLSFPVTAPHEDAFMAAGARVLEYLGLLPGPAVRPGRAAERAHPLFTAPSTGGESLAVDGAGDFWLTGAANVAQFDPTGAPLTTFTGGGLATGGGSTAVAIDGNDTVWLANANGSLTQLNSSGSPLSPSTGYTGGGLNAPTGIAIDPAGSVWVVNSGNNSVTHVFGGAAPAITPISQSTATAAMGARP
jgi:streptogramin lyase